MADALREESRPPRERLYLWLALPIGLVFALANPPFVGVPDELHHYFKALALAQGQVSTREEASAPREYVYLRGTLCSSNVRSDEWRKMRLPAFARGLTERPSGETSPVPVAVGFALPVAYAPQAAGLWLALRCRAPPLLGFYLGRLCALALATWIVYTAVRVAPFGKTAFLLVGLLPMTVQQLASYSYDSVHIATILLLTALVLAFARRERALSRGELVGLFALGVLASNAKPAYVPVALLVFLLPRRSFRSAGARWGFVLGTIAASAATFAVARELFAGGAPGTGWDPDAQTAHVLEDPLAFASAVLRTIRVKAGVLLEGIVFRPGRLEQGIGAPFYAFAVLGGALVLWRANEAAPLSRRERFVLLASAAIQAGVVFLSLYVCCTRVGAPAVNGVQGRYFLPLLPCVLLCCLPSRARPSKTEPGPYADLALVAYTVLSFAYVFFRLWGFHYAPDAA